MKKTQKQEFRDRLVGKAILGQNATTSADGVTQPDQLSVIPPNTQFGQAYDRMVKVNTEKFKAKVPVFDTSLADDDNSAYLLGAQWIAEGETYDFDKAGFDSSTLTLRKVGLAVGVTDELLEDAEGLVDLLRLAMARAIQYAITRSAIYGDNTVTLGGITGSDDYATVYVSDSGNVVTNIKRMLGAYYGGSEGIWMFSQDVWKEVINAYAGDTAFLASGKIAGYPVVVHPALKSGGMVLADWTQYVVAQRELRNEVNSTVLFVSDQSIVKASMRLAGRPIWSSTQTVEDGSVVAPFVALSLMDAQESAEDFIRSSSSSSSSSMTQSSGSSASSDRSEASSASHSTDSSGSSSSVSSLNSESSSVSSASSASSNSSSVSSASSASSNSSSASSASSLNSESSSASSVSSSSSGSSASSASSASNA